MSKSLSKTKSLVPIFSPELRERFSVVPWNKVVPKSLMKLEKNSRAGVLLDKEGAPKYFVFDTFALLDVLSEIDDKLMDKLSNEEYVDPSVNPAWSLIGEIESRLPLRPEFVEELKREVKEAEEDFAAGRTYTLEEVSKELGIR